MEPAGKEKDGGPSGPNTDDSKGEMMKREMRDNCTEVLSYLFCMPQQFGVTLPRAAGP